MKSRDYIEGTLFFAVILVIGITIIGRCSPAPEVVPRLTIRQEVMDYPYRDNLATLKAAEAKVNKNINKIIQQWNSTCMPNRENCGFYSR
jgi:hypothetical protein